jgi:hypothetical protein
MSDQGKWWKLHVSSLDDQQLENLELDNWARWARFGAYLKKHGTDGEIILIGPCRALQNLFRLDSFIAVISVIKMFPNYTVEEIAKTVPNETGESVSFKAKCLNWSNYQIDFSSDRVREFRAKKRTNETPKRRGEEKRSRGDKEETIMAPQTNLKIPEKYVLPEPKTNPTACLVISYKTRKGVPHDNREWDAQSWGRCSASAKLMLSLCHDLPTAEKCLSDVADGFDAKGITWTLETIAKHAPDWLRKNGRTDANASRDRLRKSFSEQRAAGKTESGLVKVSAGPLPVAVRDRETPENKNGENNHG